MTRMGGGGSWVERKLKGRLEPGTSVVNGSIFDNICRGWWWGRREGGLATSRGQRGSFAVLDVSVDDEKAGGSRKK